MALARTNLLGQITNTGSFGTGNFTSNSFTPSSSSLLVVAGGFIENASTTDPTTSFVISDSGSHTWTQRVAQVVSPTSFPSLVKIWTAPITTGASTTITLGTSGRTAAFYACSVVCYTGYDTGTPVGATGTNSKGSGFTGPPDPISITLSGAPATTSEVFGALCVDRDVADATPGSAFTEIDDLMNTAGPWGGLETEVRTASASTTVDWVNARGASGNIFNLVCGAIEIRQAPATFMAAPPLIIRQAVKRASLY